MSKQMSFIEGVEEPKEPKHRDWTGNKYSVYQTLGARNLAKEEREENDFYATSPEATMWLMKIEELDPEIWECACGMGHIALPLICAGYNVNCTDLVQRGFGVGGIDFLKTNNPWNGDIVTNPPYKYAQEFVEHALELIPDGKKVCMFLKVQFLEGKRRRQLFERTPPKRVWISSSRIPCGKNGAFQPSAVAYAWFVWEKGYHGETVIKWFN